MYGERKHTGGGGAGRETGQGDGKGTQATLGVTDTIVMLIVVTGSQVHTYARTHQILF